MKVNTDVDYVRVISVGNICWQVTGLCIVEWVLANFITKLKGVSFFFFENISDLSPMQICKSSADPQVLKSAPYS